MLNITFVKKEVGGKTQLFLYGLPQGSKLLGTYTPTGYFSSGYLEVNSNMLVDFAREHGPVNIDYRDETVPAQPKPEGRCC